MYFRNRRWYILDIICQCNKYIIMNHPAHRLHDLLFSGDSFVVGFLRYLHHCFREQDISLHPRAVCGSDFICHLHEDVMAWKRFPHNWPFLKGKHRFTSDSSHKGSIRSFYIFCFAVPSKLLKKPSFWTSWNSCIGTLILIECLNETYDYIYSPMAPFTNMV